MGRRTGRWPRSLRVRVPSRPPMKSRESAASEARRMPDVPTRCWDCERELARANLRAECAYCGSDVARAYEWLDALDAARAEAERWKRRHDALRAAVIKADALIVDAIHRATVMYNHTQDADYESHSDG